MSFVSAQRKYRVEAHTHGKGRWKAIGPIFDSTYLATQYARDRGMILRDEAKPKSRATVYRIVRIEA